MENLKDLLIAFLLGAIIGMRYLRERTNKNNAKTPAKELFVKMDADSLKCVTIPFFLASITFTIKDTCDNDCNKVIDCPILREGFVLMIEVKSLFATYKICLT